ncbi:MAG: hypothetical protein QXJ53_03945 [Candidatus Bathyarchaeia archaeon]
MGVRDPTAFVGEMKREDVNMGELTIFNVDVCVYTETFSDNLIYFYAARYY